MNFNQKVYNDELDKTFYDGTCNFWGVVSFLKRHNITQRDEIIKIYKMYFLSGRDVCVNYSARGRIVLKYYPELLILLKKGFIKRITSKLYPHSKKKKYREKIKI